MKQFKEFITESVQKKALHVFDIDDTLFHTTAQIRVHNAKGEHVQTLSNQEFNNHKLKPGHKYDFSEFRNAEKFNTESKPMQKMIHHLKKVSSDPHNHVILNTARADFDDKHKFLNTFRKQGINMKKIHVIRVGNMQQEGPPAEKKAKVIHGYIKKHKFKHVHLYDDSKSNLSAFSNLKGLHPDTTFHAHEVHHDGSTTHTKT